MNSLNVLNDGSVDWVCLLFCNLLLTWDSPELVHIQIVSWLIKTVCSFESAALLFSTS